MKIAFVTCVKIGYRCLQAIYDQNFKVEIVITLKDEIGEKKSGRAYLDDFCSNNSIELLKCNNINDEVVLNKLKKLNIDWLFIIGWSQIASEDILNCAKFGAIGMHPTLLPAGRVEPQYHGLS